jgi:hypothetical protein
LVGVKEQGFLYQELEFFYELAPELLQEAENLRATEVGNTSDKSSQMPSVSLHSERGGGLENVANPLGPRLNPPRRLS